MINMDGPGLLYLNRWDNHHSGTPISDFSESGATMLVCSFRPIYFHTIAFARY